MKMNEVITEGRDAPLYHGTLSARYKIVSIPDVKIPRASPLANNSIVRVI